MSKQNALLPFIKEDGVAIREKTWACLETTSKNGCLSNGSLFSTRTWPLPSPADNLAPRSPGTAHYKNPASLPANTLKSDCHRMDALPWPSPFLCPSCQRSKNSENVMSIARVLSRNDRIKRLILSLSVEYMDSGTDLGRALLAEERENGEEAYTISDVFLRNKLVFIWRVDQCCLLRINITPEGLTSLPFQRILGVSVKINRAKWTSLSTRIVNDDPTEKELVAMLDPSELNCHRLLSPCPRFGDVMRKYVKILVRVELGLDEDGVQSVDLYQTIYCRMVGRDHRMPFRCFMRRCRQAWQDMPQSLRDAIEATCFAMHSIFEFLKEKIM